MLVHISQASKASNKSSINRKRKLEGDYLLLGATCTVVPWIITPRHSQCRLLSLLYKLNPRGILVPLVNCVHLTLHPGCLCLQAWLLWLLRRTLWVLVLGLILPSRLGWPLLLPSPLLSQGLWLQWLATTLSRASLSSARSSSTATTVCSLVAILPALAAVALEPLSGGCSPSGSRLLLATLLY
jgi:hypothetical protein